MQRLLNLFQNKPMLPGTPDHDPVIRQVADPDRVVIPLDYPGRVHYFPAVKAGDTVRKGQAIGTSRNGNSVIASISGTVKDLTTVWTAQSVHSPAIIIENDGGAPLSPEEIFTGPIANGSLDAAMDRMRAAGVAPPWTLSGREWGEGQMRELPQIETVIITGVRPETTVLTSQLLLEQNCDKVADGLQRIRTFMPDARICLTVPLHLRSLAEKCFAGLAELFLLPPSYYACIEREVVARVLGRRIPNRESYRNHGIAVLDVEYLLAIVDALDGTSALTHKCITISGPTLKKALTVRFPLGSSIKHVLASQGLNIADFTRTVVGGPMTGFAQYSDQTPLTYNNGIHLIAGDVSPFDAVAPCINCGRCARVCPVNIQVHLVNRMIEFGQLESARELHPEACYECGLCASVCPAERPIVQLLHFCNHDMVHGERHAWMSGGE